MSADDTQHLASTLTILTGLLWPLLTALIAKGNEAPKIRALLVAGLSAAATFVASVIAALADGGGYDWLNWLLTFLGTWGTAALVQFGLYLPAGTYERLLYRKGNRLTGVHLDAARANGLRTW